jgi:2-polyprenyl-3-methyl-5-hydroxy-6-metoxy-1,4-benzoquinol methylase
MKKADYSQIASSYDTGRAISAQNINIALEAITRLSGISSQARLLDLGCGTGRFSIPIATRLRYRVTGADSSEEMLAKARQKDTGRLVTWDVQDAHNLTCPDNSFDIVFMSHLLHHCEDPPAVIRECWRVLSGDGMIIIRWGAIEHIRDDVEHTFFPETLAIDEARTFTVEQMEERLREAGFSGVISEEKVQHTYATGQKHLEAVKVKSTSVLTMISEDAFVRGVQKLQEYVAGHPDDPWLLYDKMTLTAGYKGKTPG